MLRTRFINVGGDGWDKYIPEFGFDIVLDAAGVLGMEDKLITAAKETWDRYVHRRTI